MAEDLDIQGVSRLERYQSLHPQLLALLEGETDQTAGLANFTAAIRQTFPFLWIGFYLVRNCELVLGPFQGPVACARIAFGQGVCGASWKLKEPLVVDDVENFPGHIACSSNSRSEIVIPLLKDNEVWAVLDIDDDVVGSFTLVDLEQLTRLLDTVSALHS